MVVDTLDTAIPVADALSKMKLRLTPPLRSTLPSVGEAVLTTVVTDMATTVTTSKICTESLSVF